MNATMISPATPGTTNAFQDWAAYRDAADQRAAELIERAMDEPAERAQVSAVKPKPAIKEVKVNDKRVAALRICDANSSMNKGQLAKLIASELEITYANAYFYSSRVWKKA